MSISNSITAEIYMPITVCVPRAVVPGVDEQTADYAASVFCVAANKAGRDTYTDIATIAAFIRAALDGTAVTVLYTHDGEVTARTLFPSKVWLTEDEHVSVKAFCTLRNTARTFRLDRMTCVQHVIMPGEVMQDEPHQDWEDSPQGRALAAR
jgi:predicted DNA-binding transcriptional regulator YafY